MKPLRRKKIINLELALTLPLITTLTFVTIDRINKSIYPLCVSCFALNGPKCTHNRRHRKIRAHDKNNAKIATIQISIIVPGHILYTFFLAAFINYKPSHMGEK